jgi:hypothetical protein
MHHCEAGRAVALRLDGKRRLKAARFIVILLPLAAPAADPVSTFIAKAVFAAEFSRGERPAAVALDGAGSLIENKEYAHPIRWSPFAVTGSVRAPW